MKTKKLLFNAILLLFSTVFYAQSYQVTGTVTDNENQPLPGVSVTIEGTSRGTSTDFNGTYAIMVETLDNLIFSYVGFNDKRVQMDGTRVVNVVLISGVSLKEVVVVGSRNPNRTAVDTPVPVDVIDISELTSAGPQVNLNQLLNYVAPSFSSNTQTISDGTDHIDPASLRGLGPDQVLVLINGKRRHTSSLVNVNGTFGRGNVGTDLNAIPSAAIERLEVLRDGAAAQYGSDAIAGVINIVLKKSYNKLTSAITTGAHFSKNSEGNMDGETTNISLNYGLPLGEKGGVINFTGDFDVRDYTNRMKEWEGNIFNLYNTVERFASNTGYDISKLLDDDVADVIQYANAAGINLNGATTKSELRTILNADNTTAELAARGLSRSDFNMRVGQSKLRGGKFFMNLSIPIGENAEIYSFAGVSYRNGEAAGFYRLPNQSRSYTPAYMNGFLPEIHSDIVDKSAALGIKGKIGDWDVDFSNTWGKNSFDYSVANTSNASLQNATPTNFEAGGYSFMQNTTNFDMTRYFDDVMAGLNIAFGAEYRIENYTIFAGNENSYAQYNTVGNVHDPTDPTSIVPTDFFGNTRPGGAQVFPGFTPSNALSKYRNSVAGYFDMEADFSEKFLASFAARLEDYSDFGSTLNFKVSSRFKATDNTNIRGAISTGFRAPSLHQLYFNSVSTLFVDGIPNEVGTFSNESRIAKILGIPQLKEETSRSLSLGFTSNIPSANVKITVDGFFIRIDDRVVLTGQFKPGTNPELQALFSQANATGATFFANAIDTETKGLDVVITNNATLGNGTLQTDLAATFSKTSRVGEIKASDALQDQLSTYFDQTSEIILESAVPRTKVNLTFLYNINKWNIFFRNVYFGAVDEATNTAANMQEFSAKVVTDLTFGYDISENFNLSVGANNLLDVYPDKNLPANRSDGRFIYSRRSQQFGMNGRFLFSRLLFKF